MSSEDHPDWWEPIGGQNSQDSILERRSLIWNDDGILNGVVPATFYEAEIYKGKFFTRGCRGMLEQLQLYCIGDGVDEITLRYSPHPCLGPVGEVTLIPAAAWAWQDFDIEEMWNYDSLFIWVHECEANVDWAYDAEQPFDGRESADLNATWADLAIRPFIRAVYTGETPGDVPVSGIINNIPIPNVSSAKVHKTKTLAIGPETTFVDIHGAGYTDLILAHAHAIAGGHSTDIFVYCDEILAWQDSFSDLFFFGIVNETPGMSLTNYAVDGHCTMLLTKKFEFRRRLRITAQNGVAAVTVAIHVHPTLMR